MQKNISFNFSFSYFVNPVHMWLQGFIADGENGVVRILVFDRESKKL